jgi:hypothetical protein
MALYCALDQAIIQGDQVMKYLKLTAVLFLLTVLTAGCTSLSPYTYTGAGVGGALGAGTGALVDSNNRWRGAMIGGLAGGALGGAATELGRRAADEDARQRQAAYPPTSNQSYDNGGYYQ